MSTPDQPPGAQGTGQPSEQELRAAYEAELSRITATDMIAQAMVSLLNIGAHRIVPPADPARAGEAPQDAPVAAADLEQARDAIDGARALLEILERRIPQQELAPLRDAVSRLQMAYAREVQGSGAPAEQPPSGAGEQPSAAAGEQAPPPGGEPTQQQEQQGPGPAEASGRLWVPGR